MLKDILDFKRERRYSVRRWAPLSLCFVSACGLFDKDDGGGSSGPSQGEEGGACYGNGTCDAGLVCANDECISQTHTGPGSEACIDCWNSTWETECEAQRQVCEQSKCGEYLDCVFNCTGLACSRCEDIDLTEAELTVLEVWINCVSPICQGACTEAAPPEASYAECRACGDRECDSEASDCDAASGCRSAVDCSLACGTDTNCRAACVSDIPAAAVEAYSNEYTCVTVSCFDECRFDPSVVSGSGGGAGTGGGSGTGGSSGGEACSTEFAHRGSCASGNGEVCLSGQWEPEECDACAIVDSSIYCGHFSAFVLDSAFNDVPGAVTAYENTTSGVVATFSFSSAAQTGFIQLRAAGPPYPLGMNVSVSTTSGTPQVSLETANSSDGCQYSLSGGSLVQYLDDGCWPDFTSYDPLGGGSPAEIVNVRVPSPGAGTTVTMTVSGIDFY